MKIVIFITLNLMVENYTSTSLVKQEVDKEIHTEHIKTNQSHSNNTDHLIDENH